MTSPFVGKGPGTAAPGRRPRRYQQAPWSDQTAQEPGAPGSAPVDHQVDFHRWPL
ncbi:MAG: hypothetical protein HOV71_29030 [Hamadaea sp.]|nr:hypothetical protein [Hamadaea sp.]